MNYKTKNNYKEFENLTKNILNLPAFQDTEFFQHHGADNNIYEHSIKTAFFVFTMCKTFKISKEKTESATIAALLHDFFGYDWTKEKNQTNLKGFQKIKEMHAFNHGLKAVENSSNYITLNSYQKDAIIKHMFPLYPIPPKYLEGWLLTLADKVIACKEIAHTIYFYLTFQNFYYNKYKKSMDYNI